MGIGWTYNQWAINDVTGGWNGPGRERANFMDVNMAQWLQDLVGE